MKKLLLIFCLILSLTCIATAHPGRTDANGGHYDRTTGEYHFHSDTSLTNDYEANYQSQYFSNNPNNSDNPVFISGYKAGYERGRTTGYDAGYEVGYKEAQYEIKEAKEVAFEKGVASLDFELTIYKWGCGLFAILFGIFYFEHTLKTR